MSHAPRHEYADPTKSPQNGSVDATGADAIRAKMKYLRSELSGDVAAAREEASQMTDWRSYVAARPVASLAAAAMIGFIIAPRTKRVLQLTDSQIKKLAQSGGVKVTAQSTSSENGFKSMLKSGLLAGGAIAARMVASNLVDHFANTHKTGQPNSTKH